jgi:transketolase
MDFSMSTQTIIPFLEHIAYQLRVNSIRMTSHAGSGHPTSCLSAADLVAALFFYAMRFDPDQYNNACNDRFILSKGHASALLYAVWKELGKLTQEELLTYRAIDSVLEGHPTFRFAYTEAATGSLGIGLSIGVGMALASKRYARPYHTYVLLGDSELSEGSVWEAIQLSSFYQLDNLVAILDCNRLGQSTQTMSGHDIKAYADQFAAFGWYTQCIDGHNMNDIITAYDTARAHTGAPTVIIAKTYKGYGVPSLADKEDMHGKALKKNEEEAALAALKKKFEHVATGSNDRTQFSIQKPACTILEPTGPSFPPAAGPDYALGESIATRKAYGQALVQLGKTNERVMALDAEVKNSTYAQLFEEQYPDRFVQCFIAEQNMVAMGVGLYTRGYIPFISTFGAFFTRAADQIRMAAIGNAALRLVGSHAGVSIGQDGPSQMALEDISLMSALPESIVLYPSDAVSTAALVSSMAQYEKGISYLRTTRMETPVLYTAHEEFPVGGCKVVRHSERDIACIVAAGVTLKEALRAYEQLKERGILVAVIDAYSVKPLDAATIERVALAAGKRVLTVEDHYIWGGIGYAVSYALRNTPIRVDCLAVTRLPRSGKPEELLSWAGIDSAAIVARIEQYSTMGT